MSKYKELRKLREENAVLTALAARLRGDYRTLNHTYFLKQKDLLILCHELSKQERYIKELECIHQIKRS